MADAEEKAKAEKLAAAKKRVAQLQKKKAGKKSTGEGSKKGAKAAESPAPSEKPEVEEEEQTAATTSSSPPPPTAQEGEEQQQQEETKHDPTSEESQDQPPPFPAVPESESLEPPPAKESIPDPSTRSPHGRQASLSLQSKLRSSSFRRTSVSGQQQPLPSTTSKSPSLPPLSPEGDSVPEVFRKQALRLEELERENKRLEKELEEAGARWKRSEEQLEDLGDVSGELVEVRDQLGRAEEKAGEVERLKAEVTALQRQNAQLHNKSHRSNNSVSVNGSSESPPSALLAQLDSKSATIEAMELEISNLRVQLNSQSSTTSASQEQISALEDKLSKTEVSLERAQRELADAKHSLNRAAEKAVKEGVEKTSTETLIKNLERQLREADATKAEADKKIGMLEKKLEALRNLHKESENRNSVRLRERDTFEKEATALKGKLITAENENLRLKEERDRLRKRDPSNVEDNEGLDELEDEQRKKLEKHIRNLEGEIFNLRNGIFQERKREISEGREGDGGDAGGYPSSAGAFDEVDLTGGLPGSGPEHARRRSMAERPQQRHSSVTQVFNSGMAMLRGESSSPVARGRAGSNLHASRNQKELGLVSEHEGEDDGEIDFDEYARLQAAEQREREKREAEEKEARKKELAHFFGQFKGFRLDLVEARYGAQGAGVSEWEIFEI
ncbi:hypothetical protein AJ79_06004 [Helicocarpus griseus UAMH5409]|uniref:M protein repeat protein n=1 Tax=Helicocarpus griseus UAMH5409 TaxID=1447875 RepID=A0A2B7XI49_9EURO|nr:hypothetical protein AJ79_06004 [Helicocarpus griseus UAMH5409]